MQGRYPIGRVPAGRSAIDVAIEKSYKDAIEFTLDDAAFKQVIVPIVKGYFDILDVEFIEKYFISKIVKPALSVVVLNKELQRLYDIDYRDIINPLQVEDWESGSNTLSFSIPIFDESQVINGEQIILMPDIDTDLQPFKITETDLSAHDVHTYKVDGEHLYYELGDGPVRSSYTRTNDTIDTALSFALENVRWQVGETDEAIVDLKSYSGTYQNPLQILRQIEEEFNCRLKFRAELGDTSIEGLYVDAVLIDNEFSGQRFEFGHNLQGVDITIDYSEVKTALVGLSPGAAEDPVTEEPIDLNFADVEWSTGDGDPADKPLGQIWVGNEEARELYGIYNPDTEEMEHRFGLYDSGAAETAEGLLHATWLIGQRRHFAPKVNVEARVSDLSQTRLIDIKTGIPVKLNHEKIRLGNICYVVARGEGLIAAVDVRIARIERYLKEPERTVVIFGDMFFVHSDYLRQLEDEIDAKTRATLPEPDRGPGATVTIASEDTSNYPEYADIIVPSGVSLDSYFAEAVGRINEDNGGHILILEGKYTYNDTLVIDKNNVTVSGQGSSTEIKLTDSAADDTKGFHVDRVKGVVIRDLVLDGNRENQSEQEAQGIALKGEIDTEWAYPGVAPYSDMEVPEDLNIGWGFTMNEKRYVASFGVYQPGSGEVEVALWKINGSEYDLLGAFPIQAVANSWVWAYPDEPILLEPGETYVYMFWAPEGFLSRSSHRTSVEEGDFSDLINPQLGEHDLYYATGGRGAPPDQQGESEPGEEDAPARIFRADFLLVDIAEVENFTLRNVTAQNYSDEGISVSTARNGEIVNCRSVNNKIGLDLWGSEIELFWLSNVRVLGCELNRNDFDGIFASWCRDLLIEHNSLIDNVGAGLIAADVVDSAIISNTCRQSGDLVDHNLAGIALVWSHSNNVNNNVSNKNRFWAMTVEDSNHNVISGNTFSKSEEASGMKIDDSDYNTIQGNKCRDNNVYGIRIAGGSHNLVTNNDLTGNQSGGLLDEGTDTVTDAGNRT